MRAEDTESGSDEENTPAHALKKKKSKSTSQPVDLEEDLQLSLSGPVYSRIDIDDSDDDSDDGSDGKRHRNDNDGEDLEEPSFEEVEDTNPAPPKDGFLQDNGVCLYLCTELC